MAVIDTTERAPAVTEKSAFAPPGHYRAAVVHEFSSRLTIDEIPRPVLEPGQILVEVEATGLCHTDIHAAHGDWPVKPSPPFVPGHEGIGIVRELGAGVTEVALGDRVAMPWLGYACGTCDYCVSGWETLCLEQKNMGYSIDGGFGEYAVAYGRYVVQVPDGIDPLTRPRSPAPASRRTRRSRSRAPARPTSSPCSASAGSATWRSSTRASPADASSPST